MIDGRLTSGDGDHANAVLLSAHPFWTFARRVRLVYLARKFKRRFGRALPLAGQII
jgi:hypothetical protein